MAMCGAAKAFAATQREEDQRLWPEGRDQPNEKGRLLAEPPLIVSAMSAAGYFPAAVRASISSGTAVL